MEDEQKSEEMAKNYPSPGRFVKIDLHTFPLSYMEVGDEQKSEEMVKKLSQCW